MRPECPKSSNFPDGCRHWIGVMDGYPCGCKYDDTRMTEDGYGPFYVTTHCNRLGNANAKDEYEPSDTYEKVIENFDILDWVSRNVSPGYKWRDEVKRHSIGILKAMIEKCQIALKKWESK